jgi:FkbM family methyltransferase
MSRILNTIVNHSNWLQYFNYKFFTSRKDDFTFINRSGLKIKVPARLMHTYKECFFDQTYTKGLKKNIFNGDALTVIDIGANVGYFSLFMFSKDKKAKVFAYEPMPLNFKLLNAYKTENPNLNFTVVNKAVSKEKTTITLNYDAKDSFSTAASIFDLNAQTDKIEVETTTLEAILNDNHLDKIDFLKLDCEGSEYGILYGASPTTLSKILTLSIETHIGKETNENLNALSNFLIENGFEIKSEADIIWAWRN